MVLKGSRKECCVFCCLFLLKISKETISNLPSLLGDLPHQSWPLFSPSSQFPTQESVGLAWALAQVSCICIDFVYLFSLSTHLIPQCSSAPCALWVLHHLPRFRDISRSTQRPEGDPGHVSEETRAEARADPRTFLDHSVSTLHTVSTPKLVKLLFNSIQQPLNKNWWSGFPGGAVVENLPANAGDTGSSPGLGRSHMPRSN